MTKVYGASDDLIEFEGDFRGEAAHRSDDEDAGTLIVMSDGTIMEIKYGKGNEGIWALTLLRKGPLFDRIDPCVEETEAGYSDIAHFKDGIKWAYTAKKWEAVQ
jgi:hypothetical protein